MFWRENPLKSIYFTGPGGGLSPKAPSEYASGEYLLLVFTGEMKKIVLFHPLLLPTVTYVHYDALNVRNIAELQDYKLKS